MLFIAVETLITGHSSRCFFCSDPSGKLNFAGKAIIHADGVDFTNGNSFTIKMDDLKLLEELGKGQYGTVQKVSHSVCHIAMAV